jgi:hypothetical protein
MTIHSQPIAKHIDRVADLTHRHGATYGSLQAWRAPGMMRGTALLDWRSRLWETLP